MADVESIKSGAAVLFDEIASDLAALRCLLHTIVGDQENVDSLALAGAALAERIGIVAERGARLMGEGVRIQSDDEWLFSPRALGALQSLKEASHG